MSRHRKRLPQQIDPFRLAELGEGLEGPVPLVQMRRLSPLLSSAEGEALLMLEFGKDDTGQCFLRGHVQAELRLSCQRCLEEMALPLDVKFSLGLLKEESEAEELATEYDPLIIHTVPIRPADMIEEELILALPQVPMHLLAECPASHWVTEDESQSSANTETAGNEKPFAVLAELKKRNKD